MPLNPTKPKISPHRIYATPGKNYENSKLREYSFCFCFFVCY